MKAKMTKQDVGALMCVAATLGEPVYSLSTGEELGRILPFQNYPEGRRQAVEALLDEPAPAQTTYRVVVEVTTNCDDPFDLVTRQAGFERNTRKLFGRDLGWDVGSVQVERVEPTLEIVWDDDDEGWVCPSCGDRSLVHDDLAPQRAYYDDARGDCAEVWFTATEMLDGPTQDDPGVTCKNDSCEQFMRELRVPADVELMFG